MVTALAAVGALALAAITLSYLKREYTSKYRPYVFPGVHVEPIPDSLGFSVSVTPKNIGAHPCKVKLSAVALSIGDERHTTPDMSQWLLLPPSALVKVMYPAGYVNDIGVTNIREGRYITNRIELRFDMRTISTEDKYEESISCAYEIEVRGEHPQAVLRPEWIENA